MKDIEINNQYGKFKFRVSAVIIKDNKVLLQKAQKYDGYCFPGGHVELGETSLEAIKRECLEELNIKVENVQLLCVLENIYYGVNGDSVQELNYFYKIKSDIKIGDDIFDIIEIDKGIEKKHQFKWISLDKLSSVCIKPDVVVEALVNGNNEQVILTDNR